MTVHSPNYAVAQPPAATVTPAEAGVDVYAIEELAALHTRLDEALAGYRCSVD